MNTLEARRRILGRNVYKRKTEGNPAIAQGSLARMYPGITMQGWSEQAQYDGNQLFDGVFTVDTVLGTDGETIQYSGRSTTDFIKVKQSTDYTGFTRYLRACYYDAGKVIISYDDDDTVTRQTPESCEYVRFCFINGSNVMFNEGSTALPYEPYTGRQPSPSPEYPQEIVNAGEYNEDTQKWEYEVKIQGKNLFDFSKIISSGINMSVDYEKQTITIPAHVNNIGYINTLRDVVPDAIVGMTCVIDAQTSNPEGQRVIYFLNSRKTVRFGNPFVITNDLLNDYFAWYNNNNTNNKNIISEIQIEYGDTPTDYESYKEPQTLTFQSDSPLTKWDKLEKRNGQWGWVYKSAEIESYTDESVPGEYFSTTGQLSTGAQVWYETTTETFVPLTASEQEAMNALHTFRPTTVLSNDCECEMTLTYKTKKSLEVAT